MSSDSLLLVGASKTNITPPLHVPYLGFDPRQGRFEGVHDPLLARAAVFSVGDMHVGILSADALGLSRDLLGPGRDFIAEVREKARSGTALQADHILLAATHAHSTPETYGITRLWERKDYTEWIETLAGQLATAVQLAWKDRKPAQLSWGRTTLRGMSCNRRDPTGPLDEDIAVLFAERDSSGPVVIANFACHPVTVQVQPLVSADFPGVAMALLERELGNGAVCLFVQGAAGDINPIRGHTSNWRDVETYGLMVAGAALQAIGLARLTEPWNNPVLGAETDSIVLQPRSAPSLDEAAATLAEAEKRLNLLSKDNVQYCQAYTALRMARETYRLSQFGQQPITAEIQCLRLAGAAITAFPGELFCELGMRVKAESAAEVTLIAECANGSLGYLAPRHEWERGGYEVGAGPWCRVAPGGPEKLVEAALTQIHRLFC